MIRTFRGPVVLLLALVLAFSAPISADVAKASRVPPNPDAGLKRFTHAQAKDVLAQARSMLRGRPGKPATRPSGDLTMTLRDLYLARASLTGPDRRAANRLLSRDTAAAKVQTSAAAAARTVTCSAHFCVHYGRGTKPGFATTTRNTLEHVWAVEVPFMGRAPLPDGGTSSEPNNPNGKLDVFLQDLGSKGIYGYCTPDQDATGSQVPAYCGLDNDFARSQYGAPPLDSLRVSAAHEFFHAIQFSWDVGEDLWFMEGTAVWMEDYVYDDINDSYQYLATSPIRYPRTSLDYATNPFPYGSFLFFAYASERRGASVIRDFWEAAVGRPTSLQAIYGVAGARAWSSFFTTFGSWNTLPLHSYSERASYPTPAWDLKKTLTTRSATTGRRTSNISHLGNSATLVTPGSKLRVSKRLLVEIDGPNKSLHPAALLQRRYRDGQVTHTSIRLNAAGNGRALVQFNRRKLSSIVVVLSNTNRYGAARRFWMRASLR